MSKLTDFKTKSIKSQKISLSGKIKVKLVLFFAISATFLIFAQLIFAGNLAVNGQKLADIEEQIKVLEAENTTLKVEIAKETSLVNLSQEAQKMGYQKPEKIVETN